MSIQIKIIVYCLNGLPSCCFVYGVRCSWVESRYLSNNGFVWDGETDNLVCIEQWAAIGQFALRKY